MEILIDHAEYKKDIKINVGTSVNINKNIYVT